MTDLTIIYYTDNSLPRQFAGAVRGSLRASAELAGGVPIVSVSHEPISFGQNICVGPIGRSYRSILFQILRGAAATRTPFVALCEHDVLYCPQHFALRPRSAPVLFDQNRHRALIDAGLFSPDRGGRSMQLVIADRQTLIVDVTAKLRICGTRDADFHKCFEPGKGHDRHRGIPRIDYEMPACDGPGILDLCNHGGNYAPRKRRSGRLVERLAPWGTIAELCRRVGLDRKAVS